jgi:hypothetical protein
LGPSTSTMEWLPRMVVGFGSARGLLFVAPEGDQEGDDK